MDQTEEEQAGEEHWVDKGFTWIGSLQNITDKFAQFAGLL